MAPWAASATPQGIRSGAAVVSGVGPLWYAVPEADAVSDVDLREHRFRQFMSSHRPPVGIGSSGPRLRENSASAMNPMNRREGHRWRVSSKGVDREQSTLFLDDYVAEDKSGASGRRIRGRVQSR